MLLLTFPVIDPVALEVGPLVIRWYALAYLAGFVLGWRYCLYLAHLDPTPPTAQDYDDFLTWAVFGTILGGRLGHVLFYDFGYYWSQPWEALAVWHGGMSFHGGMLGVFVATWVFARRRGIHPLAFGDLLAPAAPIGLFFGRVANFINGELFGRPAPDVAWAVVFPRGGPIPRHPSQLYEAALEGALLLLILALLARQPAWRQCRGALTGVFLLGYGLSRVIVEFFREPEAPLGYLIFGTTMGQWLSLPMIAAGLWLIRGWRKKD